MRLVIISGLSGAGKSVALNCMEDMGYFCVDNLPPMLIETFVGLFTKQSDEKKSSYDKIAIGVDIRGGEFFDSIYSALYNLRQYNVRYEILFLDASDRVLINRFKESRRVHPLAKAGTVTESLMEERSILQRIRENANYTIDTSELKPSQLRAKLFALFQDQETGSGFTIHVVSFGFKYGILQDADLVFDVRFINNPFYVDRLKRHTGLDAEVRDYVMGFEQTKIFLEKLQDMMLYLIPEYIQEGKGQLIIGIGCTGGMHRSVVIADALAKALTEAGYRCILDHRDMQTEGKRT